MYASQLEQSVIAMGILEAEAGQVTKGKALGGSTAGLSEGKGKGRGSSSPAPAAASQTGIATGSRGHGDLSMLKDRRSLFSLAPASHSDAGFDHGGPGHESLKMSEREGRREVAAGDNGDEDTLHRRAVWSLLCRPRQPPLLTLGRCLRFCRGVSLLQNVGGEEEGEEGGNVVGGRGGDGGGDEEGTAHVRVAFDT